MFPYQPPSTLWQWEHCSFNGRDSAVLGVLQQTHIDAMEVDTPVGSGPGRNITIAMLAGGRQRGARGCQSAHRSYGFLHDKQKRRKAFVDWGPNPNRPRWRIWQLENQTGRLFSRQMVRWFEVLTTEGCVHKNPVIWPLRSSYHPALVTLLSKRDRPVEPLIPSKAMRVTPSPSRLGHLLVGNFYG